MKYTGLNELRDKFLRFFESKGHLAAPSAPLVPVDDNSILLINAGMTPLKKYFKGTETPPRKRMTTCQKCIRTPDIENVGKTARHGTFFEMLGNFSFGDYFKKDATAWAWEFFTVVLEIPAELLYVSVYEDDDEAHDIWANDVGVARDHIVRLGKADNFWEHGSGPCGPCSEIYYDRGVSKGCGQADCKVGCDCDRFIEVWNLVFTQFDNDGKGNYAPLASKNIDTGMGLERLACVIQEAENLFEVDTVRRILDKICQIALKQYGGNYRDDVSIRIITDHMRGSTFLIADGVVPSNEGRGYVLRRLLRRAARHGRLLGIKKAFLCDVCRVVIEENTAAYPETGEKSDYILKVIANEEQAFGETIERGLTLLNEFIGKTARFLNEELHSNLHKHLLSGEQAFKLHDTYGFPLDLTKEICEERGISVDEAKFAELMERQKRAARANVAFRGGWDEAVFDNLGEVVTEFSGYHTLKCDTVIKKLLIEKNDDNSTATNDGSTATNGSPAATSGDKVSVIVTPTPFYAESGGQVGDSGVIITSGGTVTITDTKKVNGRFVSQGVISQGVISEGDSGTAEVDTVRRVAIQRNHTSAHLLQSALRSVLGNHIHQAGSYVDEYKTRFDFSHFESLTAGQIGKVELAVNSAIMAALPVVTREMSVDEAKKTGATALFGEKYGETVRVVTIADISAEFCGGTHVGNTGEIGLFKLISETAAAAGVRRIEAKTGFNALSLWNAEKAETARACAALKITDVTTLSRKCTAIMSELSDKNKEIERLNGKLAGAGAQNLVDSAIDVDGVKLVSGVVAGVDGDGLRKLADSIADKLRQNDDNYVIVVAGTKNILCVCGKAAVTAGHNAGKIVREVAALTGGKGGGKADSAMAGIGNGGNASAAVAAAADILRG